MPVGVTQFRQSELKTVNALIAKETIGIASNYPKACCSDEFFLLAGQDIPSADYYGNFSQLDDGDVYKRQSIAHSTYSCFVIHSGLPVLYSCLPLRMP